MTQEQTPALKACPFCQAQLTEPTAVQYPKMGLARLHPGDLSDGTCPIAGWGFYAEQLEAWNTRTPDHAVAGMVEAARRMLPSNLSLDNGQWPDSTSIPIDATLGELRALRDALATWNAQ